MSNEEILSFFDARKTGKVTKRQFKEFMLFLRGENLDYFEYKRLWKENHDQTTCLLDVETLESLLKSEKRKMLPKPNEPSSIEELLRSAFGKTSADFVAGFSLSFSDFSQKVKQVLGEQCPHLLSEENIQNAFNGLAGSTEGPLDISHVVKVLGCDDF